MIDASFIMIRKITAVSTNVGTADIVAFRHSNQTGASGPKLSFVQAILPAMHLRKAAIRCVKVNF